MTEYAQEAFEHHEHLKHNPADRHGRRAALAIGVLAAALAISEMGARGAQNAYLAHGIAASNEYAFYQARQTRSLVLGQAATMLGALPPSPDTAKAASDAAAESKRLVEDSPRGNGAAQIQARAAAEGRMRDEALHRFEWFETAAAGLEIAIVLCSASVVTSLPVLLVIGGVLGVAAAGLAALVALGVA